MDNSNTTPGPWSAIGPYKEGGYLDSGYLIATGYNVNEPEPEVGIFDGREPLHGSSDGFNEADAHLIAAAPELLEALAKMVLAIDGLARNSEGGASWEELLEGGEFSSWLGDDLEAARKAIAKAKVGA